MGEFVQAAEGVAADVATAAVQGAVSGGGIAGAATAAVGAFGKDVVTDIPGLLASLSTRVAALEARHPLIDKIAGILAKFFPHEF